MVAEKGTVWTVYDKRKAAVVLRKVAEGLRFTCGQYASLTVFAVSLRFTAFRRFRRILAEKSNMFKFFREHARKVTETRGSSGGIFAVSCGSLRLQNRREPRLEPHKCERGISNKCAKNLCKRTVLVQLIVECGHIFWNTVYKPTNKTSSSL